MPTRNPTADNDKLDFHLYRYSLLRCLTTVCDGVSQPVRFTQLISRFNEQTAHLRPGEQAALLSNEKTLQLYRENAKKTNDPELIFEFAVFMIEAAKSLDNNTSPEGQTHPSLSSTTAPLSAINEQKREDLVKEATALLKRLADRGHPDAQYFLADCYSNGIGTVRGRQDFDRAFPLFVLAAKHGHPDAAYRAGTCCEHGWGCRRESAKAVQFYKSVLFDCLIRGHAC